MNYLKVLGASGSKTKFTGTTSFQIYNDIIVDAMVIVEDNEELMKNKEEEEP